jgi:hypothetical protein
VIVDNSKRITFIPPVSMAFASQMPQQTKELRTPHALCCNFWQLEKVFMTLTTGERAQNKTKSS